MKTSLAPLLFLGGLFCSLAVRVQSQGDGGAGSGTALVRRTFHEVDTLLAKRGTALHLEMKWANVGVGKLYYPYALRCWLVDSVGRVCFAADTKADLRRWLPGEYILTEPLDVPTTLDPGEYDLAVGLTDPAGTRRPFLLAIDVSEKDGRYTVSRVRIR